MDKELKHELKRDEIGEALQEARGFLTKSEIMKPALAVIGLFIVLAGLYYGQKFRVSASESAFARATEVYHARVGATAPAGGESFKTDNERLEKAKTMFDDVASSYSSMAAGRRARYYSALCLVEMGKVQEAEAALKQIAAVKDPAAIEPAMASVRLAEVVLASGRAKEAAAFYKALADDSASKLPKDQVLFGLATALEAAGERLEARRAYTDLVNRHPQSPFAQDARVKADALAAL